MIKNKYMITRFSILAVLKTKDSQKLVELQEEKQFLEYDLDSIGPAIRAASKIGSGTDPSEEENECLSELKDNYPAFFDSEKEQQQQESSSLLNKIMGVKRYLRKELETNNESISSLKGKKSLVSSQGSTSEQKDQTKDSSKEFIKEKGESSKRKADNIIESEESKKHKSDTEIIDLTYNPFDDIGTD